MHKVLGHNSESKVNTVHNLSFFALVSFFVLTVIGIVPKGTIPFIERKIERKIKRKQERKVS